MRLVFAGTPQAAVPSLQRIIDSSHEVVAVLTRPDARTGRGKKISRSPIALLADDAGIPVLQPATVRDEAFLAQLTELQPDAAPVVAYGGLIPPVALAIPTHGWINLHFSLLPAWRGAAPVQHAIWHGDDVTGACTFLLEEGLDTGPIFGTLVEPLQPRDTAGAVLARLAEAQKQAAFRGMAVEYGLTYDQARPHFDRYDADLEKALKKYQAALVDALRVLQANLTKTAGAQIGGPDGTG